MQRNGLLLIICALFISLAPSGSVSAAEGKTTYAVVNLKPGDGVSEGESELITDRLRTELFKTGKVSMMERNQMQEVLKEQGFQQSGACTDEACLVEMGQMLGVKIMVIGSLGKLGSIFMINIRAIDVQTAQVVKVVSVDVKGDIEEVVDHLSKIAAKITSEQESSTALPEPETETPHPEPVEKVAPPPPAPEPVTVVVEKDDNETTVKKAYEAPDKNRNRGGVGFHFTLLPGVYTHNVNYDGKQYLDRIYLQLDSTIFYDRLDSYELVSESTGYTVTQTPFMDFSVIFQIRLGNYLDLEIGPHFSYGNEIYTIEYSDASDTLDITYMSIGAHFGLNFVKRWYPVKINAGIFAKITVPIIYYEFSEVAWNSLWLDYETQIDDGTRPSMAVIPGARAGAEFLAGQHIGFNLDFVFQWLSREVDFDFDELDIDHEDADTNLTQEVVFPMFGIGFGVNFYF